MKRLNGALGGLLVCAALSVAPTARGDSADYEECTATGVDCSTARVKNGICEYGQCWSCDGDKVVAYRCYRCETAEDAAASGAPAAPRGEPPVCSAEDTGCTVQRLGTEQGIGALFLAVGVAAFLVARRRG